LQDPTKFTQIWIFGLKTNHLATLVWIQTKKSQMRQGQKTVFKNICRNINIKATITIAKSSTRLPEAELKNAVHFFIVTIYLTFSVLKLFDRRLKDLYNFHRNALHIHYL
jgi:hypothetical protein